MPMTLGQKQRKFTYMVMRLIRFAYVNDYELTFGRAYVSPAANKAMGGIDRSLHVERLAIDLNLFDMDGKYLTETKDHEALGEFWESMGGTWGGRFNDGNHYSLEHNGVK